MGGVNGRRLYNVMLPLRDGVRLATDVYLPMDDGPPLRFLVTLRTTKTTPTLASLSTAISASDIA